MILSPQLQIENNLLKTRKYNFSNMYIGMDIRFVHSYKIKRKGKLFLEFNWLCSLLKYKI